MSDPLDLISATSEGFFTLLDGAIDPAIAEVSTNPDPIDPADQSERSFVIIGDIDAENRGEEGEQFELVSVQVIVVYRGPQRSKLNALIHQVRIALERKLPAAAGVQFDRIKWIGSGGSPPAEDGVTHAGLVEFQIHAQPAD